jgi:hypothetical protein
MYKYYFIVIYTCRCILIGMIKRKKEIMNLNSTVSMSFLKKELDINESNYIKQYTHGSYFVLYTAKDIFYCFSSNYKVLVIVV